MWLAISDYICYNDDALDGTSIQNSISDDSNNKLRPLYRPQIDDVTVHVHGRIGACCNVASKWWVLDDQSDCVL